MTDAEVSSLKRRVFFAEEGVRIKKERLDEATQEYEEEHTTFTIFSKQLEQKWEQRFDALARLAQDAGVRREDVEVIRLQPWQMPLDQETTTAERDAAAEQEAGATREAAVEREAVREASEGRAVPGADGKADDGGEGMAERIAILGKLPRQAAKGAAARLGEYTKCAQLTNGRPCYEKVGEKDKMIWYSTVCKGEWVAGRRKNLGTDEGLLDLEEDAASPEQGARYWQVSDDKGGWHDAPDVRVYVQPAPPPATKGLRD